MLLFGSAKVVSDLQRDLSFAEQIASAIIGMTSHRNEKESFKNIPVLINHSGSVAAEIFDSAWNAVKRKMDEYDTLKAENARLKEALEKYDK